MKTVLQMCLGLLLTVSAVGCHTCQSGHQSGCDSGCGHRSCLHKVADKFKGGQCGCQSDCGGDCGHGDQCDCSHRVSHRKFKRKSSHPVEATMYGYDNSVVYTGDDWNGIPQPAMGMMPSAGGCSGCAGGAPMMSMPSTGCSGCGGSGIAPTPSGGTCASCAGGGSVPQAAPSSCASCGGNHSAPVTAPSVPPVSGCASCGGAATADSFYNPMGPVHNGPAPAPPAEATPAPMPEAVPGNNAASSGDQIQKIHWVPRQL